MSHVPVWKSVNSWRQFVTSVVRTKVECLKQMRPCPGSLEPEVARVGPSAMLVAIRGDAA